MDESDRKWNKEQILVRQEELTAHEVKTCNTGESSQATGNRKSTAEQGRRKTGNSTKGEKRRTAELRRAEEGKKKQEVEKVKQGKLVDNFIMKLPTYTLPPLSRVHPPHFTLISSPLSMPFNLSPSPQTSYTSIRNTLPLCLLLPLHSQNPKATLSPFLFLSPGSVSLSPLLSLIHPLNPHHYTKHHTNHLANP